MKKRLTVITAFLLIALVFAGCGKSEAAYDRSYDTAEAAAAEADYSNQSSDFSSGYSDDYEYSDYAAEEAAEPEDYDYDESGSGSATKEAAPEQVEEYGTKIIRNASISLDVENLELFSENLKKTVYDYGGYIENMDINAFDSDYSESRYGYFTARIPAARLDDFLNIVKDEGTVTAKSESAEDVTLQYVDTEARIATYEAERDSLMELLDKATSLKDILTIRDKIAEVNYELDSLQRQLKSMQNKVSYSTVSIDARETRTIAQSRGEKTYFEKIGENFLSEMEDGLEIAIDLLIFLISRLPLFLILALVVFIIVKIIKAIIGKPSKDKSGKRKKAETKIPEAPAKPGAEQGQMPQNAPPANMTPGNVPPANIPPADMPPASLPAPSGEPADSRNPVQPGGHFTSNMTPEAKPEETKDDTDVKGDN